MPAEFNYTDLPRGGDWRIPLEFVSPPVNVSTWEFTFKLFRSDEEVLSATSVSGDIAFSSPAIGDGGLLTVLRAITVKLARGGYYGELRRTDAGNNTLLAKGTITLLGET